MAASIWLGARRTSLVTDMPLAKQTPAGPEVLRSKILITKVFVRGLEVEAEIGVHGHERGRRQPLVIDVEMDVAAAGSKKLSDTLDYETIADAARRIAQSGHIGLVETFAHRLAEACLAHPNALRARIRVEKPLALAPMAAAAGVEITAVRR